MFKFIDSEGLTVYLKPLSIESISHSKDESHTIRLRVDSGDLHLYTPESEEDCRSFLFSLFKAMGEEYKYE